MSFNGVDILTSMTQLAGSPPPGIQPDTLGAQIQELEVRDVVICGSVVSG